MVNRWHRLIHRLSLLGLLSCPAIVVAQSGRKPADMPALFDSGTIVIHLLERQVGSESWQLHRDGQDWALTSTLDFVDRGSRVQLTALLRTRADFTPTRFQAKGKTYRFVNVDVDVDVGNGTTRIRNVGDTSTGPTPPLFFTTRDRKSVV